jgi:hypothetical protein
MTTPDYMQVRDRPVGLSILAVLHLIGGIILAIGVVTLGFVFANDPKFAEMMSSMGITRGALIAGVLILAVLSLASAIGIWSGAVWGWYVGSFYYAYSISRNIAAFISVSTLPSEIDDALQSDGQLTKAYVKFGGRLLVSLLLYWYYFKPNVRAYFGLEAVSPWSAVVVEVLICAGIVVAGSLLNFALL